MNQRELPVEKLGDPGPGESLETFLARMRPRLKQFLRNSRVPPIDAEDLLQDTLLTLFTNWESIRDKERWIISTLRFKCAGYWKRVRNERLVAMDPPAVEGFSEPEEPDQEREVPLWDFETAVRRIGRKDRALLWLHFKMGLTLNEVAERLGYRPSGIRKLRRRALIRLERALSRRPAERAGPNDDEDEAGSSRLTGGSHMTAKQALVRALQSDMEIQGISRKTLAGRLGCTIAAVVQLLDGRKSGMRLTTAEKLASAVGRRLLLVLIPETSVETTFTFPPDVAERIDEEARRQDIPAGELVHQWVVKALESQGRASLVGIFHDPEMPSGEDLEDYLEQNWAR